MQIGIVGGGWSGCHLALCLRKRGYDVTILERNTDIYQGVSGNFGIRLHKGPHYPRSEKTRERCRYTHKKFCDVYPELVAPHEYSIYGLGVSDASGNPSKVDLEQFMSVCFEDPTCKLIDMEEAGYQNLLMAADMDEPSIVVGSSLREKFRRYLQEAGVTIVYNYEILQIKETATTNMSLIGVQNKRKKVFEFEKVINASGYNSVLLNSAVRSDFPFSMSTIYQPCIALVYTDMAPTSDKPFSFIVMDGWFPCIMPYIDEEAEEGTTGGDRKYILTHGSYTIMASCTNPTEAYGVLNELTDEFIEEKIRPRCEAEINRFWPCFSSRFRYHSWKGEVLCKLKTAREFRGSVTYAGPYGVVHVIPGKISNIFDSEEETLALIDNVPGTILTKNGYSYMKGGVLDKANTEITEMPGEGVLNTCSLNTYSDVQSQETQVSTGNSIAIPPPLPPPTGVAADDSTPSV